MKRIFKRENWLLEAIGVVMVLTVFYILGSSINRPDNSIEDSSEGGDFTIHVINEGYTSVRIVELIGDADIGPTHSLSFIQRDELLRRFSGRPFGRVIRTESLCIRLPEGHYRLFAVGLGNDPVIVSQAFWLNGGTPYWVWELTGNEIGDQVNMKPGAPC